eukprot:scaffold28883_cov54-Phaeocystis_antarctica.AAC.1
MTPQLKEAEDYFGEATHVQLLTLLFLPQLNSRSPPFGFLSLLGLGDGSLRWSGVRPTTTSLRIARALLDRGAHLQLLSVGA